FIRTYPFHAEENVSVLHDAEFRSPWDGHEHSIVRMQALKWSLSNTSHFARSHLLPSAPLALSTVKFGCRQETKRRGEYLARVPSPPEGRPRAIATHRSPTPTGAFSPARGDRASPRGEKDRGDIAIARNSPRFHRTPEESKVEIASIQLHRDAIQWFTISIYTAWYGRYTLIRQVTGTRTARYRTILPKIDHRQPIEGEIDVGGRLREKSGRLREKREEEEKKKSMSPARRRRSRWLFLPGEETERLRGNVAFSFLL
ncbi:hypothetical protein BHM03_00017328, partial [Ensete ventricosum]